MAKKTQKQILKLWIDAWEKSDRSNPFGMQVEMEINKSGISTFDVRNELALIKMKPIEFITDDDRKLLDFFGKANHIREMILQDSVGRNVKGQIFLLQSQFGYTTTQRVETSGSQSVVLDFGGGDE